MRHKDYSFMSRAFLLLTLCFLVLLWTGCGGGSTVATLGGDDVVTGKSVMKKPPKPPKPPPEPPEPADPAIMCITGSVLMVMDADGSNQTLLEATKRGAYGPYAPNWSPDGEKIAFMWDPGGEPGVYEMAKDGSGLSKVVATPSLGNTKTDHPVWSPVAFQDGKFKIAYAARVDPDSWRDLWLVSVDGSDPTNLTNTPNSYEDSATWSPDATRLAYFAWDLSTDPWGRDVWVHDFETGETVNITAGTALSGRSMGLLDWARTQDMIALEVRGPGSDASQKDIWVIDLNDPANPVNLTNTDVNEFSPSWSPDDSEILFSKSPPTFPFNYYLCVMNSDGTNVRVLATGSGKHKSLGHPDWKR